MADVSSAKRVLANVVVDAVLLDLSLANGERGEALLDDLAAVAACPALIILSGDAHAPTIARFYGVPLVKKPFELEAVLASIDVAIKQRLRPRRRSRA